MIDGRNVIKKAAEALNDSKLLAMPVSIDSSIDTATGEDLENIVNYFLDSVETISASKESSIPKIVISTYNNIVDKAVSFDITANETVPFDVENIVFRRTKFSE